MNPCRRLNASPRRRCTAILPFLAIFVLPASLVPAFGWAPRRPRLTSLRRMSRARRLERPIITVSSTAAEGVGTDNASDEEAAARAALQRTAEHVRRLEGRRPQLRDDQPQDPLSLERDRLYAEYIQQPANHLKELLAARRLAVRGRKPDLAHRLVADDLRRQYGDEAIDSKDSSSDLYNQEKTGDVGESDSRFTVSGPLLTSFAGTGLSPAASIALSRAGFLRPTPIQQAVTPSLVQGESLIMHAETGSGKTIAYLLPITERLWGNRQLSKGKQASSFERFVVLVPSRELAAQVAGVAMELAPPGSVRLVTHPINLLRPTSRQLQEGTDEAAPTAPRLFVASAKTMMISLYGNDDLPGAPTSKPEALEFLKSVRVLVLDEVDRLLGVVGGTKYGARQKQHEKPAAIVAAAVARHTLGRAQIVAASATVGRPLKRELSRVLGLLPQDCPKIVRKSGVEAAEVGTDDGAGRHFIDEGTVSATVTSAGKSGRAVTIPPTVRHFTATAASSSDGDLLTCASQVIKSLQKTKACRILLVLTKAFGMSSTNTIGALKHFRCNPAPISLLDALQAESMVDMIETHRKVTLAAGVGQSNAAASKGQNTDGYLLVTGEDTVRGLHLDGLEIVVVIGRPKGPDEYCHIAGRTGRAGKSGFVVNVVSPEGARALSSWETMLECQFVPLVPKKADNMLGSKQ